MSESDIERAVTKHAERAGWVSIKLAGGNDSGKPDRLYVGRDAQVVFIEFKDAGQKPRKLQLWWAKKLRNLGHKVYFIDSKEVGYAVFD